MSAMNYFINENVFTFNSGTEFSALKRLRLFRAHQRPAKIVTRNYNANLSADLERLDLSHADVVNMYDYFQELTATDEKDVSARFVNAIDKTTYHIEGIDANVSEIRHAGKMVGKVLIAPSTVGLVGSIEYYNDAFSTVAKDVWDRRGFKSSTQYFHLGAEVGTQVFFDRAGKPKIEITHMNIKEKLAPTMYKLLDYQGKAYRFNSEDEMFTFFLDELAKQDEVVLINDRPSLVTAVANVTGAKGKWNYLHNIHYRLQKSQTSAHALPDYLKPMFEIHKDAFDGIIVPTEAQKQDIERIYSFKRVLSLPDTYADEVVLNTEERAHKVIVLGRISGEKKPMDALEIIAKVKTVLPDVTLDFYGYFSPTEIKEKLDQRIKDLQLEETVTFKEYQPAEIIAEALDEASALLVTSESEAFGMQMLEALNHGVPVVAYDVNYGPRELIDPKRTGMLVPYGQLGPAAQVLANVLVSKMTEAAYQKAQSFNMVHAWERFTVAQEQVKNLIVGEEA